MSVSWDLNIVLGLGLEKQFYMSVYLFIFF